MYCQQCGAKNADGARFCENCGAELQNSAGVPKNQYVTNAGRKNRPGKKKKGTGKRILIWAAVILLLAAIAAAVIFALQKKKEKDFRTNIDTGEKYLEELNYEQAEASYLAAIEVDPKREEPYLKLAEIYTAQNKTDKAVKILEQGKQNTDSREIKEKYSLYSYVSEVLIPKYGECREDRRECSYKMVNEYAAALEPIHDQAGVITGRIMDFDGDGKDELLVFLLKNDVENEWSNGEKHNAVLLQMYEYEGGKVVLADEMQDTSYVLGNTDQESDGAFLWEHKDQIYICGGTYGLTYLCADGSGFTSWVLTYDEKFKEYTGCMEGGGGSEFSYMRAQADEMADRLEEIELTGAAGDVRDTGMMRMTYEDEGADLLFRIEGRNMGGSGSRFMNSHNPADLGKAVIRLRIGTKNHTSGEAEKVPADEIEALKEEFKIFGGYDEAAKRGRFFCLTV